MIINWGSALKPKYLSFVYGKEWDREDFKLFNFRKVPLGWDMNIWRLSVSYDDYGKVKPRTIERNEHTQKRLEILANLVKTRAYMFTCSYQTVWEQYVTDAEKEEFSFEQILGVIGC